MNYYLVCYGHVMRVSQRCLSADIARYECFGVTGSRLTVQEMTKPGWPYISQKKKRQIIAALAQKHYDNTGNVLSGCEKEVKLKPKEKADDHPGWSTDSTKPTVEHGIFAGIDPYSDAATPDNDSDKQVT